jgi:hypothetical protein
VNAGTSAAQLELLVVPLGRLAGWLEHPQRLSCC